MISAPREDNCGAIAAIWILKLWFSKQSFNGKVVSDLKGNCDQILLKDFRFYDKITCCCLRL